MGFIGFVVRSILSLCILLCHTLPVYRRPVLSRISLGHYIDDPQVSKDFEKAVIEEWGVSTSSAKTEVGAGGGKVFAGFNFNERFGAEIAWQHFGTIDGTFFTSGPAIGGKYSLENTGVSADLMAYPDWWTGQRIFVSAGIVQVKETARIDATNLQNGVRADVKTHLDDHVGKIGLGIEIPLQSALAARFGLDYIDLEYPEVAINAQLLLPVIP